ncbi:hypothetical protein HF086_011163 [Spodoptera exigua]|uniref:BRCT domain-containing protein n=1 Tax=Spodoptera exigua TaxID=7107 RepID=A0A922MUH0_SPOEX|nr:hypothetical protein HF086_011163 [Spodoptera exigua]
MTKNKTGAVWEDREVLFDLPFAYLKLRPGEKIFDRIEPIEDTKGNSGTKGRMVVTNLRIIWHSLASPRINLSIGLNCILTTNTKVVNSGLRGTTQALNVLAAYRANKYEFIFTNLSPNCIALLEHSIWNLSSDSGNLGTLIVTNVRVVWFADINDAFNISMPYITIESNTRHSDDDIEELEEIGEPRGEMGPNLYLASQLAQNKEESESPPVYSPYLGLAIEPLREGFTLKSLFERRSAVAERIRLREEWSALKEVDTATTSRQTDVLQKKPSNTRHTPSVSTRKKQPIKSSQKKDNPKATQASCDALKGVVAMVDVGAENKALPLRCALTALGATVVVEWSPLVTHLVWTDSGCRATRAKARALACKLVSPLWVEACAASNKKLNERTFPAASRQSDLPSPRTLRQLLNVTLAALLNDSKEEEKDGRPRLRISSGTDTTMDSSRETIALGKLRSEYAYDIFYGMKVHLKPDAEQREAALKLLTLCGAAVDNSPTENNCDIQRKEPALNLPTQGSVFNVQSQNPNTRSHNANIESQNANTRSQSANIRDRVVNSKYDVVIGCGVGEVNSKWVFDSVAAARMRTTRRYINMNSFTQCDDDR